PHPRPLLPLLCATLPRPPTSTLFPYTTLFRSDRAPPRLRDLHLRLDRPAERCDERASRHRQPAVVDAGRVPDRRGRRGAAEDALQLRCLRLGVLLATAHGRTAGDGQAGGTQGSGLPG